MATQSDRTTTTGVPVGDHRRLHDLLAELRHRAGDPSLRKINRTCGVSIGYLSQIFAGKTAPGPEVAVRVAQALKATDREQARARFYAEGTETDRFVQRSAQPRRPRRPGWEGCPYLGLRPFEEQHAAVFYGRRAMTSRLLGRLREHPGDAGILLVLGPSGAGKSSLLRAGLMGALADDGSAAGFPCLLRRVLTPGHDPVRQLAIHLADLAATDAISVQEALTARPEQAQLLVAQALTAAGLQPEGPGSSARVVLVVDQLEELFTLTTDPTARETFLTALHSLATEPVLPDGRPGALIVAGIRADFLDQALAYAPVRFAIETGPFTVGAMSESELREAIAGPAAEAGVRIPDDLCAVILDDLREHSLPGGFDSGALPLLSQVMFVMWQNRDTAGLTVAGYHRTGGVSDIVQTSAELVYDSLTPDRQDVARRAFTHLTATTDVRLTRRPSTRSALRTATGSDDIDSVVEAFAAQRLLTALDNDTVTIAHEELLRSWNRLRDWLQPSLTDQALHQALADDVHEWQQRDRDPSYLYHGGRLIAVNEAVQRWSHDPSQQFPVDPVTVQFLRASRHRTRRLTVVLAGLLVVALTAAGAATWLSLTNAAEKSKSKAVAAATTNLDGIELLGRLMDIRTADYRAYMLTGSDEYKASTVKDGNAFRQQIEKVRSTLTDRPSLVLLEQVKTSETEYAAAIGSVMARRPKVVPQLAEVEGVVPAIPVKPLREKLQRLLTDLKSRAQTDLESAWTGSSAKMAVAMWVAAAVGTTIAVSMIALAWRLSRDLRGLGKPSPN